MSDQQDLLLHCAAKYVCALSSLEKHRAYLDRYEMEHGKEATDKLKERIKAVWAEKAKKKAL